MKLYNFFVGVISFVKAIYRFFIPSMNQRLLKKIKAQALLIDRKSDEYSALSDSQLKAKTAEFKYKLEQGAMLDDILPDAFATVREVAYRLRNEKHYLSQLIGGIALHKGMIAEMGTGEGKTLVATLPVYLNALTGKGVHVITVNDYLAKRDAFSMGQIYQFLGLTVGCLANKSVRAKDAYQADITYGTNHDFVFDYLRDNMAKSPAQIVQRDYAYCVIDEIDNILIDEARTPCIISGEAIDASELYEYADYVVQQLSVQDYEKEEKTRNIHFTEKGLERLEGIFAEQGLIQGGETIFDHRQILLVHHLNQSLKARHMFHKGVQYIVKDDKVVLIDESTGRLMPDRHLSDGLHQAIEAKENVEITKENQTLATITYQKFFELYPKKSGMTGTAATEAEEFGAIYNLQVMVIPSNKKSRRKILDDKIFMTMQEKIEFVVDQVLECKERKQPILIGTASVEKSEVFSKALTNAGIEHQVLNAKNHAKEADIIAQAGKSGTITIATNMAGRGTDIKLGGTIDELVKYGMTEVEAKSIVEKDAELVKSVGGLFVLGTERHDNRRIDNQLLGRCGRQGDPGTALFVLSLDDHLMQIYGGESIRKILPKTKYKEAIEHPMLSRSVSKAQKRIEAYHFDSRKEVLKYDAVINDQSKAVYKERKEFMFNSNVTAMAVQIVESHAKNMLNSCTTREMLQDLCKVDLNVHIEDSVAQAIIAAQDMDQMYNLLQSHVDKQIMQQKEVLGEEYMEYIAKDVCLKSLDMLWREHLIKLENLKTGIGLKSYAQQDPVNEFKREAFSCFEGMLNEFHKTVAQCIMHHEPLTMKQTDDIAIDSMQEEFDIPDFNSMGLFD